MVFDFGAFHNLSRRAYTAIDGNEYGERSGLPYYRSSAVPYVYGFVGAPCAVRRELEGPGRDGWRAAPRVYDDRVHGRVLSGVSKNVCVCVS